MERVNLLALSKNCILDIESFNRYFNSVYARNCEVTIKEQDKNSLKNFCDFVMSQCGDVSLFSDFYFCFSIAQISKEFDILKITKRGVLNIELKGSRIDDKQIINQLARNRYYCGHLTQNIISIVYIADEKIFYVLKDSLLEEISVDEFIGILESFSSFEIDYRNIEDLFKPSMFLISPLNTPDKFIAGEYFLTDRQQEIKLEICNLFLKDVEHSNVVKLTGNPGTGKTLLIYDIAKELTNEGNVCIIHCGKLCQGHIEINRRINNLSVISIKDLKHADISIFKYILIDESHRMYKSQLDLILSETNANSVKLLFSIDPKQVMQKSEKRANIDGNLDLVKDIVKYSLTNKIRTNKEMASFIKNLFDLSKRNPNIQYKNIEIINVSSIQEAKDILRYYQSIGYEFISFTESRFKRHLIDNFKGNANTHEVIGQEYDNVIMFLDSEFYYRNDELTALEHPCPDYLFEKLLYQGITRVREKLCIVILNNIDLAKKIIEILENK